MTFFVTIFGILISVLVILYFLDIVDKTKHRNIVKNEPITSESLRRAINKTLKENQQKPTEKRLRICPICGTILNKNDYLIAAFEPIDDPRKKRKVHIYGCPYCLASDGVIKSKEKIHPDELA
ncbi:MAG: hypothetical protein NZ853_00790 [Leptospiraceae bacterium]|nr:hypothetical protein [Leptospiraceae bacterium]MDW7976235.1 hypothetical protein [Leptospiraceae bacterium]